MKIIKYTIIGTIIGLIAGLVLAIGTVGISCNGCKSGVKSCVGTYKFFGCRLCNHDCMSCFDGCLKGTCGFITGCSDCSKCMGSCGISCFSGCINGCKEGCSCTSCELYGEDCKECAVGLKNDVNLTSNMIGDNKKASHFLLYLTLIGTWIGAVFGITQAVQEHKERRWEEEKRQRRNEENERIRKQQEEDEEKRRQEKTEKRRKEQEKRKIEWELRQKMDDSEKYMDYVYYYSLYISYNENFYKTPLSRKSWKMLFEAKKSLITETQDDADSNSFNDDSNIDYLEPFAFMRDNSVVDTDDCPDSNDVTDSYNHKVVNEEYSKYEKYLYLTEQTGENTKSLEEWQEGCTK